ncbi:MAG: selenocysteine-specific translation elongation factor, partial [Planctomycetes bacterium]|nr:selenocysteine-specific translation elongation factor [Planctomycetota bacterium]
GLTIDIGFANFLDGKGRRVGIVDVPGHERFIKNMVTGATGVDLVMLVVAANDGVMPQTREHLEILELLGVTRGMVVVTKIDIVDEELLELAVEEIREALAGSSFAEMPFVMVSSHTGQGMEDLRAEIDRQLEEIGPHSKRGAFRMPIQRVFSVKGHGAVLTGIPLSGCVEIGDEVETQPSNQRGKVRSVQAYHGPRERAQAGHSSALNIASIERTFIERGHVVATPGYAKAVKSIVADVKVIEAASRPLKHRDEVRVLVDNSETLAIAIVLEESSHEIPIGGQGLVRFELEEPVVPALGDRFLLRVPSPAETLGGGRVVALAYEELSRRDADTIKMLKRKAQGLDNEAELLELSVLEASVEGASATELAKALWLLPQEIAPMIETAFEAGILRKGVGERYVHAEAWKKLCDDLVGLLRSYHEANSKAGGIKEAEWLQKSGIEIRSFNMAVTSLVAERRVIKGGELFSHPDFVISLSPAQEKAVEIARMMLRKGGFTPPSLEELQSASGLNGKEFRVVSEFLAANGEATLIAGTFMILRETLDEAIQRATKLIEEKGEMRAADFKDALETTRKFAIPILEHLDGRGVFLNVGGVRKLRGR